ncbi:MAG: peptidoglycan DD-metalloendopeptidase family protein [Clostridia bacterium]|nr:peptidoglycan DD-metalloendopeptidase family protein [Clostridia bacterium]
MEKRKIRGKVSLWTMILAAVGMVLFTPFVSADEITDYQNQLQNVNSQKEQVQGELKEGQEKAAELNAQIRDLENRIYALQGEINELTKTINDTKQQITDALAELEQLQQDIDKQNSDLNARLRSMYKNGEIGMLSVLLGSSSMSDLMTNMDMVERIYDADAQLLATIEEQYAVVEAQKEKLQELKDQLIAQQEEAEKKQAALEADRNEVAAKKKEIDADNAALQSQLDQFKKDADALSEKIKLLQSANTQYIGGAMCWPSQASTRITSPFGVRYLAILGGTNFHTGVDIGAPGGTNILAANSGTVIAAGWNNSYGYMVMIDHGGGIVTLYAHSSKLLVSKGQVVARGETIALIGSTGVSTGNHLHFEVRVNGSYQNPLNYISPAVRY